MVVFIDWEAGVGDTLLSGWGWNVISENEGEARRALDGSGPTFCMQR